MKGHKITLEIYMVIKGLLSTGKKQTDIASMFNINNSTVSVINTSKDYEDYRKYVMEKSKKRAETKQQTEEMKESDNKKSIEPQSFWYNMNRIYAELKKQTELLERMIEQWQT